MLKVIEHIQKRTWISKASKLSHKAPVEVVEDKVMAGRTPEGAQKQIRSTPVLESQYYDDVAFARILDLYLPLAVKDLAEADLAAFANAVVSQQVLDWVADAEKHPPYLSHWDMWGEKKDHLITSEGWKNLWQFGISEGLAAYPTLNESSNGYGRMIQMLKCHLFTASSASSEFHLTLSDGVARLLLLHLEGLKADKQTRAVFQHAYDRLTSVDPCKAWTSGLWMTERGGGSDLTPTETTATYMPLDPDDASTDADGFPLGPWVLDGLKWFSTGTEASMAIVVARTSQGLSAFYVPVRLRVTLNGATRTELNGVRIRRLKNKVGTKALPTAELEIKGMRGWLVGKEGKGIHEIGVTLGVTRIHLAISALSGMGRALAAARAFATVRKVARGTRLSNVPLHMRTLAKVHITYRAHLMLGYFVTALQAKSEERTKPTTVEPHNLIPKTSQDVMCLLRLLGSVAKATTAKACCVVMQAAMESLGGVGYLENEEMDFNIGRIYRDAACLTIGEGTTDVLAADVVKVLKGKIGSYVVTALDRWIKSTTPKNESMALDGAALSQQWKELEAAISSNTLEYLTLNGREIMDRVCKVVSGVVLLVDAARDEDPTALEIARRWIRPINPLISGASVEEELLVDQKIVFGGRPTWVGGP